jgi:hypothetical protein
MKNMLLVYLGLFVTATASDAATTSRLRGRRREGVGKHQPRVMVDSSSSSLYPMGNAMVSLIKFVVDDKDNNNNNTISDYKGKEYIESRLLEGKILDLFTQDELSSYTAEILDSLIINNFDSSELQIILTEQQEEDDDDNKGEDDLNENDRRMSEDDLAIVLSRGHEILRDYLPLVDGSYETVMKTKLASIAINDPTRYEADAVNYYMIQETSVAEIAVLIGTLSTPIETTGDIDRDDVASTDEDDDEDEEPGTQAALSVLAIGKFIGGQIAMKAGSYVWGLVEEQLLPGSNMPSYYGQMLSDIKRIVKGELVELELEKLQTLARRFRDAINYYNAFGDKLKDAVDLASELKQSARNGYLQDQGAFYYGEGLTYHIMTLQETYIKDKKSDVVTQDELNAAKVLIAREAREGAAEIRNMRNRLLDRRLGEITGVHFSASINHGYGSGAHVGRVQSGFYTVACTLICICGGFRRVTPPDNPNLPLHNMFEDKFTGFWVRNLFQTNVALCKWDDAYSFNWVNSQRNDYVNTIRDQTSGYLQPLLDLAASFDKIAADPVPGY